MKRVLYSTKDTYICNRIIRNSFRATDANVGHAGTLDLFKLADESTLTTEGPFISGTSDPIELSRILLKFDLSTISAMTASSLNTNHPSFKCTLQLFDVLGGQPVPNDFSLIVYPLSQSFDEGIGRDVYTFEDIGSSNFITASSTTSTTSVWFQSGANALGYVGQQSVDIVSGSMSLGDVFVTQSFVGPENLSVDVTKIVSATLAGLLPDCGLRISFSGSQETDDRTRFVKRFASRHCTNPRIRPRILVGFDDSLRDNHENFFFDLSGSLFLNNLSRGSLANIVSGASITQITGTNSLLLQLTSGSVASGTYFTTTITASQFYAGSSFATGVYSASFAISSYATSALTAEIRSAQSATFSEIWKSLDNTIGYHTGTLVIKGQNRSSFFNTQINDYKMNITNLRPSYRLSEKPRFRIFVQDDGSSLKLTRMPLAAKSKIIDKMYYRVRDVNSNDIIFDFDSITDSTRVSTDSDGMFFDMHIDVLNAGRSYCIDLLADFEGTRQTFEAVGGIFKVES